MFASILKKRSLLTVKILFLYSPEIVFSHAVLGLLLLYTHKNMNDLLKTRIPDQDKIKEGKIRDWAEDFLTLIYLLTDAAIHLSNLEIRDDRKAILDFKRILNRVRKGLKEFEENIQAVKAEKKWRFCPSELPKVRSPHRGLFYFSSFEMPYRELLDKYSVLLEEFNRVVPLINKMDTRTHRNDFTRLQSAIANLQVSVGEWNSRMNEIKIWIVRKTSIYKKGFTHKYNRAEHGVKTQYSIGR